MTPKLQNGRTGLMWQMDDDERNRPRDITDHIRDAALAYAKDGARPRTAYINPDAMPDGVQVLNIEVDTETIIVLPHKTVPNRHIMVYGSAHD